ncbi:hypothetical protein [Holospora obtusa]|uniref:hypothetical protein n=1 Tax=Holospora obtusa TaxID=49893 RepID=UPI00042A3844|nr:hypothetical protein [Holospora obtusa]
MEKTIYGSGLMGVLRHSIDWELDDLRDTAWQNSLKSQCVTDEWENFFMFS